MVEAVGNPPIGVVKGTVVVALVGVVAVVAAGISIMTLHLFTARYVAIKVTLLLIVVSCRPQLM